MIAPPLARPDRRAPDRTAAEAAAAEEPRLPVVALIDARGAAPWQTVGGLTLLARLVRSLELEDVKDIRIMCERAVTPVAAGARGLGTRVEALVLDAEQSLDRALASQGLRGPTLVVDAALVVDRRLLRDLVRGPVPRVARSVPSPDAADARVRLALVDGSQAALLGTRAADAELPGLSASDLPTFSAEMRGEMPILLLDASTGTAARAAERALVHATQKLVMDAPARWLDPPVEGAIVTWLAPTRVTPDHVTLACTALGFLAAFCLWRGWFAIALPLMYLVGWLDGVDGKLARLRLEFSRLGAQEANLDYAYENAWWIALTAHCARAVHGHAALAWGAVLIGANLVDEIAYTAANRVLGMNLDLLSPADGAFRLIAGRRNVYVAILLIATLAGSPCTGLVTIAGWAMVTGIVHAIRVAIAVRARSEVGP